MTSTTKHSFKENGYLIVKGVFKENISNVFGEINELLDYVLKVNKISQYFESIDQKYLFLKQHHPKLKSNFYDLCHMLSSVVQLITTKELSNIAKELVETSYLIDRTQVRIDDQNNDRLLPYHQETFGQLSFKNLTTWIPLTKTGKDYGGIRVIPKSHKLGKLSHKFYPNMNNYHGVSEKLPPEFKEQILELEAGDVLIFDPLLVHGSLPNPSKHIRWTVVSRINPITDIPCLENANEPMHIPQQND